MGLSFFAPLLLGGAAFLTIPWLVHQIRRPEREIFPFSSLMFVPNVYRKTIERQSLQHILLMLLRMLCILLLALAFSRPYFSWMILNPDEGEHAKHLILIDASASMQAGDRAEKAKAFALQILNNLNENDRAALASFDRKLNVLVPFDDTVYDNVQRERIEREIERFSAGYRSTDYAAVLQKAQELLLSQNSARENAEDAQKKRIIHLLSDYQKTGVSKQETRWKLSTQIQLNCLDAADTEIINLSISDIAVRKTKSGETVVTGQIKNPSDADAQTRQVKLYVNDEEIESCELSINPRQSIKTTFQIPHSIDGNIAGRLQTDGDDFSIDDRRYFALNHPRKKIVWVVNRERNADSLPASWFVSRALQTVSKENWETIIKDRLDSLQDLLAPNKPNVVVICGLSQIDPSDRNALLEFTQKGGGALLTFVAEANGESIDSLLHPLGYEAIVESNTDVLDRQSETLTWIDFEHPVFLPLKGSKYNDFSSIQFHNYQDLQAAPVSNENSDVKAGRIIARFSNESPAAIDVPYGEGRFIIWTFTPNLQSTNLPKSPRFIPILLETVNLLWGRQETQKEFLVGESLFDVAHDLDPKGSWTVTTPGEPSGIAIENESRLTAMQAVRPGVIRIENEHDPNQSRNYAANVETRETDLTKTPVNQFLNNYVSSFNEKVATNDADVFSNEEEIVQNEWGRYLLLILLLILAVETVYAARIAQKRPQTENE